MSLHTALIKLLHFNEITTTCRIVTNELIHPAYFALFNSFSLLSDHESRVGVSTSAMSVSAHLSTLRPSHHPPNGLNSRRNRSNSAPAVLTLEREIGRQLRMISDEFDMEHRSGRRPNSTQRRDSTVRANSALCASLLVILTANVIHSWLTLHRDA